MTKINNENKKLPKVELLKIFTTPKGNNVIAYKIARNNTVNFCKDKKDLWQQEAFLSTVRKQVADFNKTWITLFVQTDSTNYLATTYEKNQIAGKILDMFEALVISTDQLDKFHFPLSFAYQSLDYLENLIDKVQNASLPDPTKWIILEDALKKVDALDKGITEVDKDTIIYKKQKGITAVLAAEELPILTEIDLKMFAGSHLLQKESAENFAKVFFDYLMSLSELYPEDQQKLLKCVLAIKKEISEKYDHSDHNDFPF